MAILAQLFLAHALLSAALFGLLVVLLCSNKIRKV